MSKGTYKIISTIFVLTIILSVLLYANSVKAFTISNPFFTVNYDVIKRPFITGGTNNSAETRIFEDGKYYTGYCLPTECTIPINISYSGVLLNLLFPNGIPLESSNFSYSTTPLTGAMNFTNFKVEVLVNTTFNFTQTSVTSTCGLTTTINSSIITACNYTNTTTFYSGWRYVPTQISTQNLLSSISSQTLIYLTYKKAPLLGFFSTDIIPSLFGLSMPALAVVNSTYTHQRNESINTTAGNLYNLPVLSNSSSTSTGSSGIDTQNLTLDNKLFGNCTNMIVYDDDGTTILPYYYDTYENSTITTNGGGCGTRNMSTWFLKPTIASGNTSKVSWQFNSTDGIYKNSTRVFSTRFNVTHLFSRGTPTDATGNGNNLNGSFGTSTGGVTVDYGTVNNPATAVQIKANTFAMPSSSSNYTILFWYKFVSGTMNNIAPFFNRVTAAENGLVWGGDDANHGWQIEDGNPGVCQRINMNDTVPTDGRFIFVGLRHMNISGGPAAGIYTVYFGNYSTYNFNVSGNISTGCLSQTGVGNLGINIGRASNGANIGFDNFMYVQGYSNSMLSDKEIEFIYANTRPNTLPKLSGFTGAEETNASSSTSPTIRIIIPSNPTFSPSQLVNFTLIAEAGTGTLQPPILRFNSTLGSIASLINYTNTTVLRINSTANQYDYTFRVLPVGSYSVKGHINDTSLTADTSVSTFTINLNTTQPSLTFNGTSGNVTVIYPNGVNISGNRLGNDGLNITGATDVTYSLSINNITVLASGNPANFNATLGNATNTIQYNGTAGANYSYVSITRNIIVQQATVQVSLNGVNNITYRNTNITISCGTVTFSQSQANTCSMMRNNTNVTVGVNGNNTVWDLSSGLYNITVNGTATTSNYTDNATAIMSMFNIAVNNSLVITNYLNGTNADKWYNNNSAVNITANISAPVRVSISTNASGWVLVNGTTSATNGTSFSTPLQLFNNQSDRINVTAFFDCNFNSNYSCVQVERFILFDLTAPQYNNTLPSTGTSTTSTSIVFSINATDERSNISTVILEFDGVNYTVSSSAPMAYSRNLVSLQPGTYTWKFYVNDSVDSNTNTSSSSLTILSSAGSGGGGGGGGGRPVIILITNQTFTVNPQEIVISGLAGRTKTQAYSIQNDRDEDLVFSIDVPQQFSGWVAKPVGGFTVPSKGNKTISIDYLIPLGVQDGQYTINLKFIGTGASGQIIGGTKTTVVVGGLANIIASLFSFLNAFITKLGFTIKLAPVQQSVSVVGQNFGVNIPTTSVPAGIIVFTVTLLGGIFILPNTSTLKGRMGISLIIALGLAVLFVGILPT